MPEPQITIKYDLKQQNDLFKYVKTLSYQCGDSYSHNIASMNF